MRLLGFYYIGWALWAFMGFKCCIFREIKFTSGPHGSPAGEKLSPSPPPRISGAPTPIPHGAKIGPDPAPVGAGPRRVPASSGDIAKAIEEGEKKLKKKNKTSISRCMGCR